MKIFLSIALPTPFSMEQNHLCNISRGHHEKHIFEISLNLDQMSFKDISHLGPW